MGLVINLRGTAGSGKTELVRRVLVACGWPDPERVETLWRAGRERPLAYRLAHPSGRRPLVVLGQYGGTRGGCDTIGQGDGGLDAVFALAGGFVAEGCDVLLEGLVLSAERRRTARFALRNRLHILRLDTPVDRSVHHLLRRRRAGAALRAAIERKVAAEHAAVTAACAALAPLAAVECLPFDAALRRARSLLGLDVPERATAPGGLFFVGRCSQDHRQQREQEAMTTVCPSVCPTVHLSPREFDALPERIGHRVPQRFKVRDGGLGWLDVRVDPAGRLHRYRIVVDGSRPAG